MEKKRNWAVISVTESEKERFHETKPDGWGRDGSWLDHVLTVFEGEQA